MALKAEEVYAILKKQIQSGGATPEQIQQAVDAYLEENPVQPGATVEQAAQIEQNKQDISSLSEESNDLNNEVFDIKIGSNILDPSAQWFENKQPKYQQDYGGWRDYNGRTSPLMEITPNTPYIFLYKPASEEYGNGQIVNFVYLYDEQKHWVNRLSNKIYCTSEELSGVKYMNFTQGTGANSIVSVQPYDDVLTTVGYTIDHYGIVKTSKVAKKTDIEYLEGVVEINKENVDDIKKSTERLEIFSGTALKVLCIGDSLTEGDYGSDPAGTENVHPENYPFYLNKISGWTITNKGKCGLTATTYYNLFLKSIRFDIFNPDVVIIMLGTNGGLTDTLDTDCVGDNYENYSDTNTGNYCKIIEYIIEQLPHVQIILCAPPHVGIKRQEWRDSVQKAYPVIKKIGERYSLPVLDLYKESGFSDYTQDIYQPVDNLHFNAIGYQKMATFIFNGIKSKLSVLVS